MTTTLDRAERLLAGLNPHQREAVAHMDGPLLILAGPGSGKTRVIVHRVAHLLEVKDVHPSNVLAVTFTNKAARELRERLDTLAGGQVARGMSVGTFHSNCARWLRRDIKHLGREPSFAIYDDNDQVDLVKQILKELEIDEKRTSARAVLSAISHAKSELIDGEAYARDAKGQWQETVGRVYKRYTDLLERNHALDFDDLLVVTVQLFREVPEILGFYQRRFQYVMVDEFQDTNIAQYEIVKLITKDSRNLCVVGDEDQSIYSWRSADIRNILNFENDFPELKVVVLEQNYRSTSTILQVARAVIASNKLRKEKNLWTHNDTGVPVTVHEAYNEQDEALYVLREIERLHKTQRIPLNAFGILYRTNAQSRAMEDAFVRAGMPYRLVGGIRFYERREVKDVLAYLRLIHNPFDAVSLQRVINVPPRGIGQKTVQELLRWSDANAISAYEALVRVAALRSSSDDDADVDALAARAPFGVRGRELLGSFADIVEPVRQNLADRSILDGLDQILEHSGYARFLQDGTEEGEERWANVQELRNKAQNYDELEPESALAAFLEDVSLVQDVDQLEDDGSTQDAVTLITLHAAKGLEFPTVFLVGIEEGVLPHQRSVDDPKQLEEERRLFYVGITRAMRSLYLVRAFRRTTYGTSASNTASRFLLDVPSGLVMATHAPGAGRGTEFRAWSSPREERPAPFTRAQAREMAARKFAPTTQPRSGERPPPRPPRTSEPTYIAGDRVRHPTFGVGIVVSVRQDATSEVIDVNFAGGAGVKKLDTAFAPLSRE